jgi:hypothetical protein
MIRTMIGLAAAAATMFTGPHDSGYGNGGGRGEPSAKLTVSYLADAGFAAAVKLECDPAGGGHPEAAEACAELEAAGGDPGKIEPTPHTACMMIYQPIAAHVDGVWRGTTIKWEHRYGNSCEMKRALRVLVAF